MAVAAANRREAPGRFSFWLSSVDATLIMAWLGLLLLGLVMVTSATSPLEGGVRHYLGRHALYAVASAAVGGVILLLPLKLWELTHRLALVGGIALCCLVLVPGLSEVVNGSRRWISVGPAGVQAAEVAKLCVAIYLAGYLAREGGRLGEHWLSLVKPVLWVSLLVALIFLQPDFGTMVVIVAVTGAMLFLAGARIHTFVFVAVAAVAVIAFVAVLEPYRIARLTSFRDPWAAALDDGYQLTQALIAFGRGGPFGLGLGDGVQKLLYLPEAHNDFIFAVIAEELGLLGAFAVIALLAFVTLRMLRIARQALAQEHAFAGHIAYAAALFIGLQTLINIGVNTGVLPTKGLTLPFLSYGGNSLVVCTALVALAVRARMEVDAPRRIRAEYGS